jgi:uncharacterized protein YjlB
MLLKDQIKNYAKKLAEDRPGPAELHAILRNCKPLCIAFSDDGIIPNNPRFPLIIYRGSMRLAETRYDPAAVIDMLFESNGWSRSWRDTVYDFVHYHSQIHEVMGVARGSAMLEFGGIKGRKLRLKGGDVAILPAGTGHRLVQATHDFLVVGAYPESGSYDECTDTRERGEAAKRIAKCRKLRTDPVFGKNGPLIKLWHVRRH